MVLVITDMGVVPAKVWHILEDDTLHVHWFNSATQTFTANAMMSTTYLDQDMEQLQAFTWTPTTTQEQHPVCGIVQSGQILGHGFELEERGKGKFYLPSCARETLATWLQESKKKN
jgi:hypothetical protein